MKQSDTDFCFKPSKTHLLLALLKSTLHIEWLSHITPEDIHLFLVLTNECFLRALTSLSHHSFIKLNDHLFHDSFIANIDMQIIPCMSRLENIILWHFKKGLASEITMALTTQCHAALKSIKLMNFAVHVITEIFAHPCLELVNLQIPPTNTCHT